MQEIAWYLVLYFTVMAVCLWVLHQIRAIHWAQVVVLLLCGLVQLYAGVYLFRANFHKSFQSVEGVISMVPMMMDMKGNLEVAMASRMSILASTSNEMDSIRGLTIILMNNAILLHTQVVGVSFLASTITVIFLSTNSDSFISFNRMVLLFSIAVCTSSVACSAIGTIMTIIVSFLGRLGQDPNDVATSMAASFGDLFTVMLVAFFTDLFYKVEMKNHKWIYFLVPLLIILPVPYFIWRINRTETTSKVLTKCWPPLILSMIISLIAGFTLESKSEQFKQMTIMLPLMSGLLGNAISVITSLIGTTFELNPPPAGTVQKYLTPWEVFIDYEANEKVSTTCRSMMIHGVIPCFFIYLMIIGIWQPDYIRITVPFVTLFLSCAVFLMFLMIFLTVNMVHLSYQWGLAPSDNVIPVMTSVIDMCASFTLWAFYEVLVWISDPNAKISIEDVMKNHSRSF